MVPPYSDRIPRVPPYLSQAQYHHRVFAYGAVTLYGTAFTEASANASYYHLQAGPSSLATTLGISVDFFSSGYLDVSVRRVRFHTPMYSAWDDPSHNTLHVLSVPERTRLLPSSGRKSSLLCQKEEAFGATRRKCSVKGRVSPFGHCGI